MIQYQLAKWEDFVDKWLIRVLLIAMLCMP
jgi:hypothetical protein